MVIFSADFYKPTTITDFFLLLFAIASSRFKLKRRAFGLSYVEVLVRLWEPFPARIPVHDATISVYGLSLIRYTPI